VPKLGRDQYKGIDFEKFFEPWKRRALELLGVIPADEWDWLAIAQHHGLVTGLLDWSFNPLAAAFFAAYPMAESDCTVYAYRPRKYIAPKDCAPVDCKGIGVFKPRGIAARITRQGGIFTHHNPPDLSLEDALNPGDEIHQIVITGSYRKDLVFELDRYGFNRMTLFPDLDGLSEYCNWACHRSIRAYWTREAANAQSRDNFWDT
jgi:hypothetical protein